MHPKKKQTLGQAGETAARKLLQEAGFSILEVNWRFRRYEIDIIATDNRWVVFAEVKTRSFNALLAPELTVSVGQQRRIIAAANHYLVENKVETEARFDIISIIEDTNGLTVKHLPDAFRAVAR
jgi:putative endonuclease